MLLFPREDRQTVGEGHHRSGWPFVFQHLLSLKKTISTGNSDIWFDDFIDRSFSYDPISEPYTVPWGGIFHHPPKHPWFGVHREKWDTIFSSGIWNESLRYLKFAIFTSKYQEKAFSQLYPGIPTIALLHPTELNVPWWSISAYDNFHNRRLVQIGSYLRDTRAVHRIKNSCGHEKIRLMPRVPWLIAADRAIRRKWESDGIEMQQDVKTVRRVSDHDYDTLLSGSIAITIPFTASACNVIVECIARCTPVITVKLDPVVEYLGDKYPLYTDMQLGNIHELLQKDRILAAHRYLIGLNRTTFDVLRYTEKIGDFIRDALR